MFIFHPTQCKFEVHGFEDLYRPPSGQFRVVYQVKQLRTDSVHWPEYAGTRPVVPKVNSVVTVVPLQVTMNQLMYASLLVFKETSGRI